MTVLREVIIVLPQRSGQALILVITRVSLDVTHQQLTRVCLVWQPLAKVYPVDSSSVGPAMRIRTIINNNTDDFSQAGARFRSFDSARQVRACSSM